MSIRIWKAAVNDDAQAWDIPARITRSYSQDVVEVRDDYDLAHVILKRSGSRNIIQVGVNLPFPLLAQENVMTMTTALAGENNDVVYTSKKSWRQTEGQYISVAYIDPSANSASLSISVSKWAITVNLATDTSGTITSTADDIKTEIAGEAAAHALVSTADSGTNDGSGVVIAMAAANLTGTALRVQLKDVYITRALMMIFDENETQYYSGYMTRVDELIIDNEIYYAGDVKDRVLFGLIVTADGTYSTFDDLTSITPTARPF